MLKQGWITLCVIALFLLASFVIGTYVEEIVKALFRFK